MSAVTAPAPEVLASGSQMACGETNPAQGVRCARPHGHKGAHLSRNRAVYWQAEVRALPAVTGTREGAR